MREGASHPESPAHGAGPASLRDPLRYFRAMIDSIPLAIVVLDECQRVSMCNPAFEQLFGYREPDILGQAIDPLVARGEHLAEAQELTQRNAAGQRVRLITVRYRSDGQPVDVEIHGVPLLLDGRVVGTFAVYQDITERKRAEDALRASERRYRLLFERNLAGVYRTTLDGRILDCNEAFARMFGFSSPEEARQHSAWELHPHVADRMKNNERLLESGQLTNYEACLRRIDGRPLWVLQNVTLIEGDDGALTAEGTVIDITERKRAEDALRASEQRYRELFENAHDFIYTHDLEGRFISLNRMGEGLTGCPAEEAAGRSLFELVVPEMRERVRAAIDEASQGRSCTCEFDIVGRQGRRISLEASLRPIYADGQVVAVQGIARDVTERKQAESSLRRLSARLLRLQDEERRRIARELHDTVAQQLAALAMYLSVLRQEQHVLSEAARQALAEALTLVEQCSRETRTFSYLLHPPLLDEAGLVSAIRWYVDGFSRRSGIPVWLDLPAQLERLPREVETALFRIVQESLTNVHRHSGSPRAEIALRRSSDEIRLEVRDVGRGISPEILDRLGAGAGMLGVGIAGMRERMKQLGGRLEIESGGTGTVVRAILTVQERSETDAVEDSGGRRPRGGAAWPASPAAGTPGVGGVRRGRQRARSR